MFKIGEFSKLMQITIRMLRYYDEMGLLKPACIDEYTGYRMYSIEQIPILNKIIYLRDSGFSVSEISKATQVKSDNLIIELLDKKYEEVKRSIQAEQNKLNKIELAKREIQNENSDMHYNVSIKAIPSYRVLSLRKVIPTYYEEGKLWKEISDFAQQNQILISSNTFSIYHDDEYKEENVDVELCVPVKELGTNVDKFIYQEIEAIPIMACTMVYGPFSNIAGAYISFAKWLQKNNQYRMIGANRQIVHRGPWNEDDPQRYLVEIQTPLEKK